LEINIMANHNRRPQLAQSQIIDLKGRPVGSEDLESAALALQWAEHSGYRGTDLQVATAMAQGLRVAIELSERGNHQAAGKQAGNCLWVLKKNRELCTKQNRRNLGCLEIQCRDGQTRKLGNIVEWYAGVHSRIHDQIEAARAEEAEELANAELEALQFAASVATGQALQSATERKVKAA
jgi:hypothetical protein